MTADLALAAENFLQLAGAFIVFSLARIAYRGVRETHSRTMLRMSLAFILLGAGFTLSGISGLAEQGLLPSLALFVSLFFLTAAVLEVLGYFFLAFSHAIDVVAGSRSMVLPTIAILPAYGETAFLKSAAVVLLLYGVVETTWSYLRSRRKDTLIIAIGFALITVGEFISWLNVFFPAQPPYLAASLVVKILGFVGLYIPVLRFSLGRMV